MAAVTQNILGSSQGVLFATGTATQPVAADVGNDFLQLFTATDSNILSFTVDDQAENAQNSCGDPNEHETSEIDLESASGDSNLWQTITQFMALVPKVGCPTVALKTAETAAPDTGPETGYPSEFATSEALSGVCKAQPTNRSLLDFLPVDGKLSVVPVAADLADGVSKRSTSLPGAASQSPPDPLYPETVVTASSKGENKASSPSAVSLLPHIASSKDEDDTPKKRAQLSGPALPGHSLLDASEKNAENLALIDPQLPKPLISAAETAWRQKWGDESVTNYCPDTLPSDFQAANVKNETMQQLAILDGKMLPLSSGKHVFSRHEILSTLLRDAENVPQAATQPVSPSTIASLEGSALNPLLKFTITSGEQLYDPSVSDVSDNSFSLSLPTASSPSAQPAQSATPGLPPAVALAIIDLVQSGQNGPLEIALSPEELGRLTISIKQDGDFVHVSVVADRPETLDLMRRHAGDLVADLKQSGFSGATLSFGHGGRGHQPRFADAKADHDEPVNSSSPETRPTARIFPRTGSGVDMRF